MRQDRRLSRVLHILLHLHDHTGPISSTTLGTMLQTDGAFVRRAMAGLRERGWVASTPGRTGGWSLAVPLTEISLWDLYEALGAPGLFALGTTEDAPTCLLEQAANAAVDSALSTAQAAFRRRMMATTVADLVADFEHRLPSALHPQQLDPAPDTGR